MTEQLQKAYEQDAVQQAQQAGQVEQSSSVMDPVSSTPDQLKQPRPPEEQQSDVEKRLAALENQSSQPVQEVSADNEPQPDLVPEVEPEFQLPEGVDQFAEQFKTVMGFELKDLQVLGKELQQYRQKEAVVKMAQELQSDWGIDRSEYDRRIQIIGERFKSMSPEQRQHYDSTWGAKALWNEIEIEQLKSGNGTAPRFQRSSGVNPGNQRAMFTKTELDELAKDPAAYARNADAILYAYQNGLVSPN